METAAGTARMGPLRCPGELSDVATAGYERPFRSPYEKALGLVHLPRLIDKMRAVGTPQFEGYNYKKSGFDAMLLSFLGIDGDEMEGIVREGQSDDSVLTWIKSRARNLSPDEARVFNHSILDRGQQTDEERRTFEARREQRYPGRGDLSYYVDLIEQDEGGVVYKRPLPDSFYS